jgi:heme/copper-type cytochrome/quinol oxidase subunit 1
MTITESPAETSHRIATISEQPAGFYAVVTTGDHKILGRLYVAFAFLFFAGLVVLGILNGAERLDTESLDVFGNATAFFQSFWLYRVGLVFLVAVPLFVGLATAVVPLQVGSPAIAFPRAAAAAFWGWLVASLMLIAGFATDGGLGALVEGGADNDAIGLTLLAFGFVIVSLLLASVCIVTTVIAARTTGMSLRRVPLFSWSMLVAGAIWLASLPVLLAHLAIAYVDFREGRLEFGLPAAIHQQLEWAFRQPQVYAYAIPVLGIMSEIVPVAARVRQRLHDVLLFGIGLFGVVAYGAGVRALDVQDNFVYPALGFAAVVPVLLVLGCWGDSLRRGRPGRSGPIGALALAGAACFLLIAGVVSGALRVLDPLDLLATSTTDGVYSLVVLSAIVAGAAGAVYWAAKLTGRAFPEGIARLAMLPLLVGAGLVGLTDVISGFLDQPAQVGVLGQPVRDSVEVLNLLGLVGMALVALGVLAFLAGLARMFARGPRHAPNNPWDAHTLEWATLSPPPLGNFGEPLPEVRSERPLLDRTDNGGAA